MSEHSNDTTWPAKLPASRLFRWSLGILLALLLLLYGASFSLDEPLRRITEKKINQSLKGYSVRLSGAHLQLIGLSYTLKGLTILQQEQLLENRSHKEVATKADISGKVGNPETSTWQIVGKLLSNAFLKAILPNFEKALTGSGRR